MREENLLAEGIRLWKISEDLQEMPGSGARERAYETGYRVALNTIMEEIRPGINWAERVKEYRKNGEINVEY